MNLRIPLLFGALSLIAGCDMAGEAQAAERVHVVRIEAGRKRVVLPELKTLKEARRGN